MVSAMLIHRICAGVSGSVSPSSSASATASTSPPLVGSVQAMTLRMLSYTTRPSCTAATMEAKLSSASTTCEASLAASVPFCPMAMPTSACLSEGASFTPSPVMATTAPWLCSARTTRSLCSGLVRANTSVRAASAGRAWSGVASTSAPVATTGCAARPSWAAMAAAVAAWSPVIICTRMPALWQSATAAMASGRGGSMKPIRPAKLRPCSSAAPSRAGRAGRRAKAKPSTRSPSAAMSSTRAAHTASSTGSRAVPSVPWALVHMASTCSGAPLTAISAPPSGVSCSVAM